MAIHCDFHKTTFCSFYKITADQHLIKTWFLDDDCVLKGNDQLRLDWIAREKETKDTP
ncbi:hypothetical protein MTR_2g105000 [Medicago truncatula]|uniref:Uncharacterized protein n=1 Tax=Medicago truncatula TaxID=3880 RepID=A0A072VDF8_MEDTR|nr:hypothetical protein MTR_2g105000 [Medicago truncatula]